MNPDPRDARCWAEIDLNALRGNLAWLRHRVGPEVKITTVVKADAYGHGLKQIAALLMQSGTDVFGVANLAEAAAIRSVGKGWPILMLGACLPHEIEAAAREEIMPTLSSLEEAQAFSAAGTRLRRTVRAHLKIDTGMGRLGAAPRGAVHIAQEARRLPHLELHGIYTHYSSAEDDAAFTRKQQRLFDKVLGSLRAAGIEIPTVHTSNSAAFLLQPQSRYNMVRPGLLVYGVIPHGKRKMPAEAKSHLRPALSWKSRLSLVKELPAGTPLSYGRTFVASRKMRIGVVACGYGDGLLRAGSNRVRVLVGGRLCRVVGRITMDQTLIDLSRVKAAQPGDEVVLIGRQGESEITANDLAKWCGTIPWEVLTNITYRVPRIYRGASAA
jgi:alanine racemase